MESDLVKDRAWLEINLDNLEHNIKEIQRIIPSETKIMAVVKANAYGHGLIKISKKLNEIGIDSFAVATLKEGIEMRKNKITGDILILGYTCIENIKYVLKYDLIQTIVDEDYARKMMNLKFKEKVKVHIKINTGMNRLGICCSNIGIVKEIYHSPNLDVQGIFSHLSSCDEISKEAIEFTKMQIDEFDRLIENLRRLNLNVGKVHLQSSYGIVNYNELQYDYVRSGIIMYGIYSESNSNTKIHLDLKPVLSLKARITSVREISASETVGYDRKYMAKKKEKLATVSIGYADGYPRNLSCKGVKVRINEHYAEVIGRICMDQLVINISGIEAKQGDIVTLIGEDKNISAQKLSRCSGTITNELLSRMGERLEMV